MRFWTLTSFMRGHLQAEDPGVLEQRFYLNPGPKTSESDKAKRLTVFSDKSLSTSRGVGSVNLIVQNPRLLENQCSL